MSTEPNLYTPAPITPQPAAPMVVVQQMPAMQAYTIRDASGREITLLGTAPANVAPQPEASTPAPAVEAPLVPRIVKQIAIYAVAGGLSLWGASLVLSAVAAAIAAFVAAVMQVLIVVAWILGGTAALFVLKAFLSLGSGTKDSNPAPASINQVAKGLFAKNIVKK
ncbi:hypothetical protein [Streptomyces sp. NPDC051993]|uniref:hypothetical protein n=1 Tax=Streptomyces sp. NPDC051993 TaxID=3155286 RepID=UPI00343F2855